MHSFSIFHRLVVTVLALSSFAVAQEPRVTIDREGSAIHLQVEGTNGHEFAVESGSDLRPGTWQPLITSKPVEGLLRWEESSAKQLKQHYYRVQDLGSFTLPEAATNFRLTDHLDVSHELEYQHDEKAVVLFFVDDTALRNPEFTREVAELYEHFAGEHDHGAEDGVVFWLVHSSGKSKREAIATMAEDAELEVPVLHDAMQLVALDFGIETFPEVVALDPEEETIFYRGAVKGKDGAEHLEVALTQHLADEPVVTRFVRPFGSPAEVEQPPNSLTYTKDIAPILLNHCVVCHSLGNIAPFSMNEFATVEQWAGEIKEEVLAERMPPWHADPKYGHFTNNSRMPAEEAAMLVEWVNQGVVRGEGEDPVARFIAENPPEQAYPFAWPVDLGEPDYVIEVPEQNLPSNGEVDYRYITVNANLPEDTWLRAAVVLPGNQAVVHHVLMFDGDSRQFIAGLSGYFSWYVPGADATEFPEGTGKFLKKNQDLTFQMHYITTGKPEKDLTRLGLYVMDEKPERELVTKSAFSLAIDIPPHAPDYEVTASMTFDKDTLIYEMSPHMHYRGSRFRYEANFPDGTKEVLLSVPKYWFDWQRVYRFGEPMLLPAGTKVTCIGAFDNSKHNHENPNPNQRVRFGEQTDEEMFIGYMNIVELP